MQRSHNKIKEIKINNKYNVVVIDGNGAMMAIKMTVVVMVLVTVLVTVWSWQVVVIYGSEVRQDCNNGKLMVTDSG